MSYGPIVVFPATIASGSATSSDVVLARGWKVINVQVGTMSTAAAISIQNSADEGSTYYNVFHNTIQSATVATPQVFIASGVGTNGGVAGVPVVGLNRIRFVSSAVVSGGVAFKVICSD